MADLSYLWFSTKAYVTKQSCEVETLPVELCASKAVAEVPDNVTVASKALCIRVYSYSGVTKGVTA